MDLNLTDRPQVYELSSLACRLRSDSDLRNHMRRCPTCNSNIEDRFVTLYRGLIDALYRVYRWCAQSRRNTFETREIKHLLGKNEYARFGDLVRFGGIVYKPKDEDGKSRKALFGINMERAREFFAGTRQIPIQIVLNQITNQIEESRYVTVDDFPELKDLLREDGLFDHQKSLL